MKKITISAPGKLMLFGEHAVVYNRPCIVTAVDQRMFMTIEQMPQKTFRLDAEDVFVMTYEKPMRLLGTGDLPKAVSFVEQAVKNFHEKYPMKFGVKVTTKSDFSAGFGFGSSSASTVCAIEGLARLNEVNLSKKEIFDLSYKTILAIQGSGSGFDVAAALYGGTLYFVTGGKVIQPMTIDDIPFFVGYTGFKADTPTIVKEVAERASKDPDLYKKIYDEIEQIVNSSLEAFLKRDWKKVGFLMNMNQKLLEKIGVSSAKLSAMIQAAQNAGAYGAKLSGAGVGDCMIAIAPPEKYQAIETAVTKIGGQVIHVQPNVAGVRKEI